MNTLKTPHIHVMGFTIPLLPEGAPVAGIVTFRNIGDGDARIAAFEYVFVRDTPPAAEEAGVEDRLFDAFIRDQIRGDAPTYTIGPGQIFQRWNFGPVLTQEEKADLEAGRKVIYFMGTVRYQGPSGAWFHTDYCFYERPPVEIARGRHNTEHVPLDTASAR